MLCERDYGWLSGEAQLSAELAAVSEGGTAEATRDDVVAGRGGGRAHLGGAAATGIGRLQRRSMAKPSQAKPSPVSMAVVAPEKGKPLTLEALEARHDARTLVLDLRPFGRPTAAGGASEGEDMGSEPLGMLPPKEVVTARVRAALLRGGGRRNRKRSGAAANETLPAGSRHCVERLLAAAEGGRHH